MFKHDDDEKLIRLLIDSSRISNMRLIGYVNKLEEAREMQFAAVALLVGDGTVLIAYRGTDDTLIGFKEDCNMAFAGPRPGADRSTLLSIAYRRTDAASHPPVRAFQGAETCPYTLRRSVTNQSDHASGRSSVSTAPASAKPMRTLKAI